MYMPCRIICNIFLKINALVLHCTTGFSNRKESPRGSFKWSKHAQLSPVCWKANSFTVFKGKIIKTRRMGPSLCLYFFQKSLSGPSPSACSLLHLWSHKTESTHVRKTKNKAQSQDISEHMESRPGSSLAPWWQYRQTPPGVWPHQSFFLPQKSKAKSSAWCVWRCFYLNTTEVRNTV